jgi:hypothetical protein
MPSHGSKYLLKKVIMTDFDVSKTPQNLDFLAEKHG